MADFTEEEEEDFDEFDDEKLDEAVSAKKAPTSAVVVNKKPVVKQKVEETIHMPAAVTTVQRGPQFSPYVMPVEVGIYDNELGTPVMKDTDMQGLMMQMMVKIMNDIEAIRKSVN